MTSEKLFWHADSTYGLFNGEYYAGPWGSYGQGTYPWMQTESFEFFGKGHSGNTANYVFGDSHVEALSRTMLDNRTKGDKFWPPSDYCDFNGYATP